MCTEILKQGPEIGISFEVNNIDTCKKALAKMQELPYDKINELKNSSKQLVKDVFTWEKVASETMDVLNNISIH